MTPQKAPYKVGTRLRRITKNGAMSGAEVNGETVWFDRDGNEGEVVEVQNNGWMERDEETGEYYPIHGYSVLQFDDDENGVFRRCIDVDDLDRWSVL